jgi:ABC-type glutathione transport system ATPase component
MNIQDLLIFAPLILIQLGLAIAALVDLIRRPKMSREKKILWVVIILFINIIGPVLYFVLGRKEE